MAQLRLSITAYTRKQVETYHDVHLQRLCRFFQFPSVPHTLHRQVRLSLRLRARIVQITSIVLRCRTNGLVLFSFRGTATDSQN